LHWAKDRFVVTQDQSLLGIGVSNPQIPIQLQLPLGNGDPDELFNIYSVKSCRLK